MACARFLWIALAWMALVECEAKGIDCFEKAMRFTLHPE